MSSAVQISGVAAALLTTAALVHTDPGRHSASRPAAAPAKVMVYYFHRTVRCPTCLSIEAQVREAVHGPLADLLADGRIAWQVVDFEEEGNEHFEADFKLERQALILAETTGEKTTRWKDLPKIWDLVEDRLGFRDYVVKQTREFVAQTDGLNRPVAPTTAPARRLATTTSAPATAVPATQTAKGKLPRMVDLGADKCIPCKQMAPILKELRTTYAGRANIDFIDVWKNPGEKKNYAIRLIPTQIFYDRNGKEVWRHEGFLSREEIVAKLKELGA